MVTLRWPLSKTNVVEVTFLQHPTVADIEMLCKYLELTKRALADKVVPPPGA